MNFDKKSAGFGSKVSFQYRIMCVGCFHFSTVSCSSILPFITNISTILISSIFLCFRNSSRSLALHWSTVFGILFASTVWNKKRMKKNSPNFYTIFNFHDISFFSNEIIVIFTSKLPIVQNVHGTFSTYCESCEWKKILRIFHHKEFFS